MMIRISIISLLIFISFLVKLNAQSPWKTLSTGTTATLSGVFFISDDTGYVVGDSATALTTTDGGITWKALKLPDSVVTNTTTSSRTIFYDIFFTTPAIGFICGRYKKEGILLRTDDGGITWRIVLITGSRFNEVMLDATGSVFMVGVSNEEFGSRELLMRSIDSGKSWIKFPQAYDSSHFIEGTYFYMTSIDFQDSLHWLATFFGNHSSTNFYGTCRTFNGGKSWEKLTERYIYEVKYNTWSNQWIGIGIVIGSGVHLSVDFGETWKPIKNNFGVEKLYFIGP